MKLKLKLISFPSAYLNWDTPSKRILLTSSTEIKRIVRSNRFGKSVPTWISFLISSLIMLMLAGKNTKAQDTTAEIDKLFSWATPSTPGCVCAVSLNGKMVANRAYGMADLERNVPLTPNSVFDVASVTKQFVAAAVLMLVEEKRLSLTDDVHKYITELPDYGHKITIDQLLTHTSGLRDWTGLLQLAGSNVDVMTLIMRQHGLNFIPGEEWSYSNTGYVLLKEIVGRISGMSFSEYAHKHLFEPLGMKSTVYQYDLREVIKNRALAYDRENGHWKLDMKFDNDRGGGGALLSTASDLLIWNEALSNNRLGSFVTEKLQEAAKLNNGRSIGYARGLFLNPSRGGRAVGHTGGSAGYGSILTRVQNKGFSIAIVCNSGSTGDKGAAVRRLFDFYVPPTDSELAQAKSPDPALAGASTVVPDLDGKAGLFFNDNSGDPIRLIVNNNRLSIVGGPGLIPVAKDRFRNTRGLLVFMSGDEFELQFLSQDEIELKSMEGKTIRYRRAKAYTPTPNDLKAFAGRYESKEVGTAFQIVPTKDGLKITLEHSPDRSLEIKPVNTDTFQIERIFIRFRRDKAGKPVALDYSNPVLRNLRFTKLSDR